MSGMLLPDWFFFSFTKKISQLNAKEKVNLNSPMSKTMYKNFINNKCVEWRNIFQCKKNISEKQMQSGRVSAKRRKTHSLQAT